MILDAAAGNRTMWRHKNSPNIIYIDIEKRLERKPTVYADNTNTPFLAGTFDTVFYDPPHGWGDKTIWFAYTHRSKEYFGKWGDRYIPRYYGTDKHKTRTALIAHIYRAQKEFYRILKDDGLLWLKWNAYALPLKRILQLFEDWHELLRIFVCAPSHTFGTGKTYWVCLCKKKRVDEQTSLG